MYKILFPEANNEFIKAAATELTSRGVCEPIAEESDLQTASVKILDGIADAMIAGIDFTSRDVICAGRYVIGMQ